MPRTVMFALAAQGEYLLLLKSSLAALANLLCLGADRGPLPRLGICALEIAAKTGKVQLKVKLRPSELSLYDFHTAALKIQPNPQNIDPVDGAQAALALKSLTQVLLQDAATSQASKTIVLITDHLMRAADFQTYLAMDAGKRIRLQIIVLCDSGYATDTAAAAYDWNEAEATHPDLTVTVVEIGGRVAVQSVARALLTTCSEGFAPLPVAIEFPQPFLGGGNLRSLHLEAHCEIRPLELSLSHAIVCACHSAPLALRGSPTDPSSASTPVSLLRAFHCQISGNLLSPAQCVQDGRSICVGSTASGVLHSSTPISITAPSSTFSFPGGMNKSGSSGGSANGNLKISGAVLRVLSKINIASTNSALIVGPSITLKPPISSSAAAAAIKVAINGEMVAVSQEQLLTLVITSLRVNNQAFMVETTWDLHSGKNGLFKLHYLLVPGQNSSGSSLFSAVRIASLEELAPRAAPAPAVNGKEKATPPAAAVVAAVESLLAKVPEEANRMVPHSSRVHETVGMLVGEARPPPKPAAAAAAVGAGSGGGTEEAGGKAAAAVAVAKAPAAAPAAERAIPQGGRGAGNGAAPQATGGRGGRGGRGGKGGAAATASDRRRR